MTLTLHQLFPTVVATTKLAIDPLDLAGHLQTLIALRGEAVGNPSEGCAWTGDINGVWQLHRQVEFAPLVQQVSAQAERYLAAVGFDCSQVALHLQRCWPVLSDWDQLVGRHHHPNAHLSAVLYLTGAGSGEEGVLRVHSPLQSNELVPGLSAGHAGPIAIDHPFNGDSWDLAPEVGLLVLFPSRLDHSVLPNGDPESLRCSISFDFVLTAPEQGNPPEYLAPHPSHWSPCSDLSS
ncbi:TIGR02466 family protein [Synechococcus sp. UW179B]|uniref:TIGR02466 family protein n=1 Tax=Synechococcus sp. UW179B TaxID=2575516 RepID=UPI00148394FC|nr:TIGR02466 family protein [Synechococcus sp. UW179B]